MNQQERKEKSKTKILDSAVKLFAAEGYANCSTTKIAKEAGVSYGLLYYHFKNKGEMLESVLTSRLERLKANYQEISLTGEGQRDFDNFLDLFISSFQKEKDFWFVYTGVAFDPKVSIASIKTLENQYAKLQNRYLIDLFGQLGVEHPLVEAFFVDSCLYALLMRACTMKDDAVLIYGVDMLRRKYCD